jgi:membrane peptidoglycan carboxypeptidase
MLRSRSIARITSGGRTSPSAARWWRAVAKPDDVLVTNMMRSVLNEGTAASAREWLHARCAGKTGTTNDLRDVVCRPPELLTVVWIAATTAARPQRRARSAADLDQFMKTLAGRASVACGPRHHVRRHRPQTASSRTPNCRIISESFRQTTAGALRAASVTQHYFLKMNREVFAAVAAALERGEPARSSPSSPPGSTPQRVGAKMLVFGDGRMVGTIGGGC